MQSVVILSGGQDSTTCLFDAVERHGTDNVYALTIDYHQRHDTEVHAAQAVRRLAGIPNTAYEVLLLGKDVLKGTSPLTDPHAKLEQYEHHSKLPGGLERTFVPTRNLMFLTIAANRAYVLGAHEIVIGVSQEDFGGYPDCRAEFLRCVQASLREGLGRFITIHAPLLYMSKAQTIHQALKMKGCYYAMAFTHTAYDGKFPPVGKDHASLLRAKGFEEAGAPDPLVLRAYTEGLMELPDTPNYQDLPPRTLWGDDFSACCELIRQKLGYGE